jgi:hypothetical protein
MVPPPSFPQIWQYEGHTLVLRHVAARGLRVIFVSLIRLPSTCDSLTFLLAPSQLDAKMIHRSQDQMDSSMTLSFDIDSGECFSESEGTTLTMASLEMIRSFKRPDRSFLHVFSKSHTLPFSSFFGFPRRPAAFQVTLQPNPYSFVCLGHRPPVYFLPTSVLCSLTQTKVGTYCSV